MAQFGFDNTLTTMGHFGAGVTNFFDVDEDEVCDLDNCDLLDAITILINNLNISGNFTNIVSTINNLNNVGAISTSLKLIQSDIDELKKRTKYWEDRNLLRQTPDEKTGRADFRSRRQDLGGKS